MSTIMPTTTEFDAGLVFSGKASGVTITGFESPTPYTPAIDQNYLFTDIARDLIVWLRMEKPEPLYIHGASGTGKSSSIRQIAARINLPVYEITASERMEVSDLVGHYVLVNGQTEWVDGPLTMALRNGGICLIDEVDTANPAALIALNGVLDGTGLIIAEHGGELVSPHPLFRLACTGNSAGNGDSAGFYSGISQMNLAFMDRFMVLQADYPTPEAEAKLLTTKYPALPENIASTMVRFAGMVRKLFTREDAQSEPCEITITTRSLIRWADLTLRYEPLSSVGIVPLEYAADRAFANRASVPTKTMLHELLQRVAN